MKRRDFLIAAGSAALVLGLGKWPTSRAASKREIAITFDDPNTYQMPLLSAIDRNARILKALKNHGDLKVALFVCGERVDNPQGRKLLKTWSDAGHIIGNHSYSHLNYGSRKVDTQTFIDDFRRGDAVIRDFSSYQKLFRYPFLKQGETVTKRDKFRVFLREHGWRVGHVTVDASDWYVNDRLTARLKKNPHADTKPYRDYYLAHILNRVAFYDDLAQKVVRRPVRHTLLLHHSLLSALFLDELLLEIDRQGWQTVDADYAYQDSIFDSTPNIIPAGESLIWALAKETGKFDELLRYPGEDSQYEEATMDSLGL